MSTTSKERLPLPQIGRLIDFYPTQKTEGPNKEVTGSMTSHRTCIQFINMPGHLLALYFIHYFKVYLQ